MSEETGIENVPATGAEETKTTESVSVESETTEEVSSSEPQKAEEVGTVDELADYAFDEAFNFSAEQREASLNLMRQFGVSNKEQADKLVGFLKKVDEERQALDAKQTEDMMSSWDKALDEDTEFSKNYEANMITANKALRQYGSSELQEWLKETGFNRNPEVVKMFYRIGKDLEEAKIISGNSQSSQALKHDRFGQPMFTFNKSFGDK